MAKCTKKGYKQKSHEQVRALYLIFGAFFFLVKSMWSNKFFYTACSKIFYL
jgi:hypothetical protein